MTVLQALITAKSHALTLPKALKEDVDLHVLKSRAGPASLERAPFRRQLDLWAYSVATAVASGLEPVTEKEASSGNKFKDTGSIEMSAALCTLIAAAAMAGLGPEDDRAREPAEIVKYANRLAAAGCRVVIERLRATDLRLTPLDKVHLHAEEMLEELGLGGPASAEQAVIE